MHEGASSGSQVWEAEFSRGSLDRKVLLYLANDVLQNSRKKSMGAISGPPYPSAGAPPPYSLALPIQPPRVSQSWVTPKDRG